MTVLAEVAATYRNPAGPVGRMVAEGPREDRSLAILMGAMFLMFVARAPVAARAAHLDPTTPLEARLGINLFAMVFLVPVLAYALAFALRGLMGAVGCKAPAFASRVALFWAMLAITPLALAQGLLEGFLGPQGLAQLSGLAVFAIFGWFVVQGLRAACRSFR